MCVAQAGAQARAVVGNQAATDVILIHSLHPALRASKGLWGHMSGVPASCSPPSHSRWSSSSLGWTPELEWPISPRAELSISP